MIMSRDGAEQGDSEAFYSGVLSALNRSGAPYLVGGTCAINEYIGLRRPTKDLDVFCRAGDYPRLLGLCGDAGYEIEVEDERWIAKIRRGEDFCDVVFGSANMVAPVTDAWFVEDHPRRIFGVPVKLLPPTELVWSKVFIMDRYKFDGNDVVHIILRKHDMINWKRLLTHHEQHWEVLLVHLLRFRYIYPAQREIVPAWLLTELFERIARQSRMPAPALKVCRGRIFSRDDFIIDITDWGMADLVGDAGELLSRTAGSSASPEPLAAAVKPSLPAEKAAPPAVGEARSPTSRSRQREKQGKAPGQMERGPRQE